MSATQKFPWDHLFTEEELREGHFEDPRLEKLKAEYEKAVTDLRTTQLALHEVRVEVARLVCEGADVRKGVLQWLRGRHKLATVIGDKWPELSQAINMTPATLKKKQLAEIIEEATRKLS